MQNKEKQSEIQNIQMGTGIGAGAAMGTVFGMFPFEASRLFLETTLKNLLFPFLLFADIFQAILAWRRAQLSGFKNEMILKAVLETLAGAAITVAVLGSFLGGALFALATPIIFTAVVSAKAIYHGVSSIYHAYKAVTSDTLAKKAEHKQKAIADGIGAVTMAVSAVAVGLVMLAGKFVCAFIGAAAAAVSVGYGLYSAVKKARTVDAAEAETTAEETRLLDDEAILKNDSAPSSSNTILFSLNPDLDSTVKTEAAQSWLIDFNSYDDAISVSRSPSDKTKLDEVRDVLEKTLPATTKPIEITTRNEERAELIAKSYERKSDFFKAKTPTSSSLPEVGMLKNMSALKSIAN